MSGGDSSLINDGDKIVGTTEVCNLFSVTRQTVLNWRRRGMPVFIANKKTFRYKLGDILCWLNGEYEDNE